MTNDVRRFIKKLISIILSAVFTLNLSPALSIVKASETIEVPNGNFEEMTEAGNWIAKDWNMTKTVWITNAAAYDGVYSQSLNQWNCESTLSQVLTVEPGIYDVSLYVWADGSLEGSFLTANIKSVEIKSGGATQIDGTKTWDKIELQKVRVENDGSLTLSITINKLDSTVTGFLDSVSFQRTGSLPQYPAVASDGVLLNGGFDTDYSDWSVSDPDAVLVDAWSPNGDADKKLSIYKDDSIDVDVYQNIKNLKSGSYTINAKVYTNGSQASAVLYADPYDGQSPVSIAFPSNSRSWVPISINADVEDGYLTIGFHVTGNAGMWLGIDDVELIYNDSSEGDEYILDNGFENNDSAWVIAGVRSSGGHDGSDYALVHEGASELNSYQTIDGIEDGYYTLTAWTKNSGGQDACYLYAADIGSSDAMTAIPRNNFPYDSDGVWKKVTVRGFQVTSGRITVGLYTKGGDTSSCLIDNLHLSKENGPYELLIGGDITELSYVEDHGGKFFDFTGEERDPLEILAENGWNIARIRVYNNPGKGYGDGEYYLPEGYQDEEDALNLAKRAKDAGMQIQLSFHYSDYWSNPGRQIIPYDWQFLIDGKTDEEAVQILNNEIYNFTKEVLMKMNAQGTTPEYVSLGNETRSGMLFPYGSTGNWDTLAGFYNAGARAVRETSLNSKIIIHLDDGGNISTYLNYFRNANQRNVDYDIIGTSYYPYWTNKSSIQFAAFADSIAKEFEKPVMCMETGFNWTANTGAGAIGQLINNGPYGGAGSSTPLLQRDFMIELFNEMQGVNNGMCIGDLYWDPIMIYAGGHTGWAYFEANDSNDVNVVDNTTLFDFDGNALPVLSAYKYNTCGMITGMAGGKIVDAAGMPISGATVKAGDNQVTTNNLGDYFFPALTPGIYEITAEKQGLGNSSLSDVAVEAGKAADRGTIRINAQQTLFQASGTVLNKSEVPIKNALIKIIGGSHSYTVLTDNNGQYTLKNIPSDIYDLQVSCVGYVTYYEKIQLNANQSGTYTLYSNTGAISGFVYDAYNEPLSDAIVSFNGKTITTQNDGSFFIDDAPTGTNLTLNASKPGYMDGYSDNFSVVLGETTSNIMIRLPVPVPLINSGFEDGFSGWIATADPSNAIYTQTTSGGGRYSPTKLSAWCDTGISYEGEVSQKVDITDAGDYLLTCYTQSGGGQDDLYVYVKDSNGEIIAQAPFQLTTNWVKLDLRFNAEPGEITIGFYVKANGGTWCNLDDFSLGLESAAEQLILIENITISGSALCLVGETVQFTAKISPDNADDKSVLWSIISGAEYATIDANGLLQALSEGIVTIRASANDSSQVYAEKSITILPDTTELTFAETPVIIIQPQDITVTVGENAELSVEAVVNDGGTLSYQWYSNTAKSNTGGTPIGGAVSAKYEPLTDVAGTMYYYVIVTNTNTEVDEQSAITISDLAALTVKQQSLDPTEPPKPTESLEPTKPPKPTESQKPTEPQKPTISLPYPSGGYNTSPAGPPTIEAAQTPAPTPNAPKPFETLNEYHTTALVLADQLYKLKLFVGTGLNSDGTPAFELSRPLTRLEALTIVVRLMGLEKEAAAYTGENPFTDVPSWGDRIAAFAYSEGITAGVNNEHTLFAPDRLVTYQEFTAFLLRVLGYSEKNNDFKYDQALNKAIEISLYGMRESPIINSGLNYLRADAVIAMTDALLTNMKGSNIKLLDKLVNDGLLNRDAADDYVTEAGKIYSRK